MKVLEALASAIAAEGIDRIFAVIGDANQEIIVELCEKHGLKFVHTHHETAAVGMADGYARFSGKIGLASTTQGSWLHQCNDLAGFSAPASIAGLDAGRTRLAARSLQSAGHARPTRDG
ncbi:MAG: thiamine pyrophosphate-binding protein [Xanthobacteraceae bacterium]